MKAALTAPTLPLYGLASETTCRRRRQQTLKTLKTLNPKTTCRRRWGFDRLIVEDGLTEGFERAQSQRQRAAADQNMLADPLGVELRDQLLLHPRRPPPARRRGQSGRRLLVHSLRRWLARPARHVLAYSCSRDYP